MERHPIRRANGISAEAATEYILMHCRDAPDLVTTQVLAGAPTEFGRHPVPTPVPSLFGLWCRITALRGGAHLSGQARLGGTPASASRCGADDLVSACDDSVFSVPPLLLSHPLSSAAI